MFRRSKADERASHGLKTFLGQGPLPAMVLPEVVQGLLRALLEMDACAMAVEMGDSP